MFRFEFVQTKISNSEEEEEEEATPWKSPFLFYNLQALLTIKIAPDEWAM